MSKESVRKEAQVKKNKQTNKMLTDLSQQTGLSKATLYYAGIFGIIGVAGVVKSNQKGE